jgi:NitT/TauT family transport system substrate-binding protein
MKSLISLSAASLAALALATVPAAALDQFRYGTNWLAEAEHGGFYQAVADGTYEKYGLDVTIVQGGPQAPNEQLLIGGKLDGYMGGMLQSINDVAADIPVMAVAAMFQKDPQVLLAHPDAGFETFNDLAKADKYILGKDALVSYFLWMKSQNPEFSDDKYVPYTFNPGPFVADKNAIQQGYVTSEPFAIKQQAGWEPKEFLLADAGYAPYSTTIEVMKPYYESHKDIVKRFVEASIIGWYNYLYGDNTAANDLIKKDNPDITDDQIAFSIDKMKEFGIVDSGIAKEKGVGCMDPNHWHEFYDQMSKIGVFPTGLDIDKAFTTELVCQGVGMDLAKN